MEVTITTGKTPQSLGLLFKAQKMAKAILYVLQLPQTEMCFENTLPPEPRKPSAWTPLKAARLGSPDFFSAVTESM